MKAELLKTYNIEIGDQIVVVEAVGCSISHSGALIFTGLNGSVVYALNTHEWEKVWVV